MEKMGRAAPVAGQKGRYVMGARSSGSMDVRCERCGSQYELDEDRVTEAGVAVRGMNCDHAFMVRKQAVAVTSSISQLNGPRAASRPMPNAGTNPKTEPMPPKAGAHPNGRAIPRATQPPPH